MLTIAIVIAACVGAHAADERVTSASAFRPWALNDSKAFVFPRIAEKRNRVLLRPPQVRLPGPGARDACPFPAQAVLSSRRLALGADIPR